MITREDMDENDLSGTKVPKKSATVKIWVKFIFAESPKNPEMRSTYEPVYSSVNQISYIITSYNVIISFNIVI